MVIKLDMNVILGDDKKLHIVPFLDEKPTNLILCGKDFGPVANLYVSEFTEELLICGDCMDVVEYRLRGNKTRGYFIKKHSDTFPVKYTMEAK